MCSTNNVYWWQSAPDESDLKVDTTVELHEESHRPQVVRLIAILCLGSYQQVLIAQYTTVIMSHSRYPLF